MTLLLVDIGNTTVDFRLFKNNTLTPILRINTSDQQYKRSNSLKKLFISKNIEFDTILFVSVVPAWNDIIRALGASFKAQVYSLRDFVSKFEKDIKLDNINALGADFIANFYGAKLNHNIHNGLVVSMGTASTLLLVEDDFFIGTIICPGLKTALSGLINSAALLKELDFNKINKKIGTSTIESISIGAYNAHFKMLCAIIDDLKQNYSINNVIFTGGHSNIFKEEIIKNNFIFDESLIFNGLITIYKKYIKSDDI